MLKRNLRFLFLAGAFMLFTGPVLCASTSESVRQHVLKLAAEIRRADYEDDRPALQKLFADLSPFVTNAEIGSRVHYWRGFAMWRRAINGFNDNADPKDLQQDLQSAVNEFEEAVKLDPSFVDAKVGGASSIGMLAFASRKENPDGQQERIAALRRLIREAQDADPDNPRLAWVVGLALWNTPLERGGGQAKSIEMYEKGLTAIRKQKTAAEDSLDPVWGEPELMMSLAWCQLNRTNPDVTAAERYAQSALEIVPHWHYLKDILMPQIQKAKKAEANSGATISVGARSLLPSSAGTRQKLDRR